MSELAKSLHLSRTYLYAEKLLLLVEKYSPECRISVSDARRHIAELRREFSGQSWDDLTTRMTALCLTCATAGLHRKIPSAEMEGIIQEAEWLFEDRNNFTDLVPGTDQPE